MIINDYVEMDTVTETYDNLPKPRILTSPATLTELETVDGCRFYSEYDEVFTSLEVKYVLYQMPSTVDGKLVSLQSRNFKSRDGDVDLEILWDSTFTAGTPLPIFDENRNTDNSSNMEVSIATVTVDGTIRERDFITGVGQGSNSSGDVSPALGFRIYSPDSFFIAKVSNLETKDNRIHLSYSWLEVPTDSYSFS